jgi:hypothetical protein
MVAKVRDNIQDKVKAKLGNSLTPLLTDALKSKFGPKVFEMITRLKNGDVPCARPCTCGTPGGNNGTMDDSTNKFVREMDNYSAKLMEDFVKTMINDDLPPIMRKTCTDKFKAAFPKEKILEVILITFLIGRNN